MFYKRLTITCDMNMYLTITVNICHLLDSAGFCAQSGNVRLYLIEVQGLRFTRVSIDVAR